MPKVLFEAAAPANVHSRKAISFVPLNFNNMKQIKNKCKLFVMGLLLLVSFPSMAQSKKTLAVLNLDVKGMNLDANLYTQILRLYVEKLDSFIVLDRYDQSALLQSTQLPEQCYGTSCLAKAGEMLNVQQILSGSIEKFPNRIVVSLKIIESKTARQVVQKVMSFIVVQDEIEMMITLSVNELMGIKSDGLALKSLLYPDLADATLSRTYTPILVASGPRMGYSMVFGEAASIIQQPEHQGGFASFPGSFHFGYQFEKRYLNEDGFQALLEFIPMISGMDQGRFIPSVTLMNGIRGNKNGWESAAGPHLSLTQKADGFYGPDGNWYLQKDSAKFGNNKPQIIERMDSRGEYLFETAFVFAIGKTSRSKFLNIPVNIYVMPKKGNTRIGISVGYNSSRKAIK